MNQKELVLKCNAAAKYWGKRVPMKVIEEMSELAQALSKYDIYRDTDAYDHVLEEMADVYISLAMLRYYLKENDHKDFDVYDRILEISEQKLNRKYPKENQYTSFAFKSLHDMIEKNLNDISDYLDGMFTDPHENK